MKKFDKHFEVVKNEFSSGSDSDSETGDFTT